MASPLPALRANLDLMPSPAPQQPGLLIRDPLQYSDRILVIPPFLVPCLALFDGEHTTLDLHEWLVRRTGRLDVSDIGRSLREALSEAGFLQDERYLERRRQREAQFAAAPVRAPAHAGSGYPQDAAGAASVLQQYLGPPAETSSPCLRAIAAPHVSPQGGWQCYRAAYRALPADAGDRTFVILGTSHYGAPDRFGLTRKPFRTPFGDTLAAPEFVDELLRGAPAAVVEEDYCHAVEHSIEFQVVFLQCLYGAAIRVLPILCGPFLHGLYQDAQPVEAEPVRAFLDTLGNLAHREGRRLLWVLGVDMAHMGRRYQDPFDALADQDAMLEVASRDRQRIELLCQGNSQGFWELVRENHDDLKWCGSAPFYAFSYIFPHLRGELIRYEQWNIDPHSVVSFAGMAYHDSVR